MTTSTGRRTQEERRTATRAKLLTAAVECLLERGYSATTVAEVQERAGLARGTLLHHFPTKADLMVAASLQIVSDRIERGLRAVEQVAPGPDRLTSMVDLAWEDLNSPDFFTLLELWVAARTDLELRDVLIVEEAKLFRSLREGLLAILGEGYGSDPRAGAVVEFTVDLLTGLSLTTMLSGRLGEREPVLDLWKRAIGVLLGELEADRLVEPRTNRTGTEG